jgi:MarR family 2-MHQ and catechol resistance regulon transcriptional repressor
MGTHYRGTTEETRALDAFIKLMRAANTVTERIHGHLAPLQLTTSQFGVLEMLHHLGSLCQREIAEKLLKSGGNVTLVLDNLEKRGLVKRKRSQQDRRFVMVHLTDDGSRLMSEVFPRHVAAVVREMGSLTPSEQEELDRLCRKLGLKQPQRDVFQAGAKHTEELLGKKES